MPKLAKTWHISRSTDESSSRVLAFLNLSLFELELLHPVQWEAIEGCGVVVRGAHPKEFSSKSFVGLLKEGEENSPSDPAQAHPEIVSRAFGFKEMKEHVE